MKVVYPNPIEPYSTATLNYMVVYFYTKNHVTFYSQTDMHNHDILAKLKLKSWKP